MKKINFFAGLAFILLSAWSCQKGETTDTPFNELSTTESLALVASVDEVDAIIDDNIFYSDDFFNESDFTGKGNHYDRSGYFSDCAFFEITSNENTVTVIISFEEGCKDRRGNELSGTITMTRTKESGNYEASVAFTDFTINGYIVNGSKTYSKIIENSNGNPERTITINITVETDGGTITKTGTRTREVTAGGDTDTYQDDEITITGSGSYTSADGIVITAEITTPLVRPAGCKFIAQGVKQYTNAGVISVLDYGDGTCDNLATLTAADGSVTEIELRRGRKDCKASHD
ncbi:hypothetical protein [Cellulophaga tyrosinoxydans]|uniref:Lipoprotein n=1 Tax=Cellulophaga tyrosinoxydans TaxID=504486 RepID=A0A1W1YH41_9FLAO|nr:hypothetical protein [Cellulophaga tyrosinoxydans]SMC35456.1 hypothetical protein SAMN05660703_0476 [Cellulophaga tyrosinoxydans]